MGIWIFWNFEDIIFRSRVMAKNVCFLAPICSHVFLTFLKNRAVLHVWYQKTSIFHGEFKSFRISSLSAILAEIFTFLDRFLPNNLIFLNLNYRKMMIVDSKSIL